MSNAGKATYFAKVGAPTLNLRRSHLVSGKDQTAHTKLKYRQLGQDSIQDVSKRDFKTELTEKESLFDNNKKKSIKSEEPVADKSEVKLLTNIANVDIEVINKYDDADADLDPKKDFDSSEDEDEDDDDDEDDDEKDLLAELERIKNERMLAQAKKEQEQAVLLEKSKKESAIKGNPLINIDNSDSAKIKRRWNDDVVFRNQARDEPEVKKRFINDTVRNDFHKQFLKKYVR